MSALSAISLSGMNAAQTQLRASAHNIANLSTPNFRREQVAHEPLANGGVAASSAQADQVGHALETDLVGQLVARNQFLANFAVFKTSDQLAGSLFRAIG